MIKLNNTEARQNVEPLHQDQLQYMCESMSQSFSMKPNSIIMGQRLIDSYQNLQHFWDVVGGWEGLDKVKTLQNAINAVTNGMERIQSDIEQSQLKK